MFTVLLSFVKKKKERKEKIDFIFDLNRRTEVFIAFI